MPHTFYECMSLVAWAIAAPTLVAFFGALLWDEIAVAIARRKHR